jgi:hypothetical protein
VYEEPTQSNRRVYFGAVNRVNRFASGLVTVPGKILGGVLGFVARYFGWIVLALIALAIYSVTYVTPPYDPAVLAATSHTQLDMGAQHAVKPRKHAAHPAD